MTIPTMTGKVACALQQGKNVWKQKHNFMCEYNYKPGNVFISYFLKGY